MSRLADYFVVVGYDHDKESKFVTHTQTCVYKMSRFKEAVVQVVG